MRISFLSVVMFAAGSACISDVLPITGSTNCDGGGCGCGTSDQCGGECVVDADCVGKSEACCQGRCVDIQSDPGHCGGCNACPALTGAMALCSAGHCSFACNADRGDCDGDRGNGCEADLTTDVANCRACGLACTLPNANGVCTYGCAVASCQAGFDDCNLIPGDGCETSVLTDKNNCGGCATTCAVGSHGITYHVGGNNTFNILNNGSCEGFAKGAALGANWARVTVTSCM